MSVVAGAGKILILSLVVGLLGACGSVSELTENLPDRRVDYKKQRVAQENLEVPPDLTSSSIGDSMPIPEGGTTYSEFNEQTRAGFGGPGTGPAPGGVLPQMDNIRVMRDGNQRWLEIQAPPTAVWPRLISFWRENGVILVQQDPATGVMRTDWLENRADIKQGFITELFRKVLDSAYSAATRDQFRVRLEPGDQPGATHLYLTHRGMEEELVRGSTGETENSFWVSRPTDPGLEAEMLRRIMVYLGTAEKRAEGALAKAEAYPQHRAQLTRTQAGTELSVDASFADTWRMVGMALERVGFMVEDRDRSQGFYEVRYDDPLKEKKEPGFFAKLAFWRDQPAFDDQVLYRIRLAAGGDGATRIRVLTDKDAPVTSDTGERILTLIHEQLR